MVKGKKVEAESKVKRACWNLVVTKGCRANELSVEMCWGQSTRSRWWRGEEERSKDEGEYIWIEIQVCVRRKLDGLEFIDSYY